MVRLQQVVQMASTRYNKLSHSFISFLLSLLPFFPPFPSLFSSSPQPTTLHDPSPIPHSLLASPSSLPSIPLSPSSSFSPRWIWQQLINETQLPNSLYISNADSIKHFLPSCCMYISIKLHLQMYSIHLVFRFRESFLNTTPYQVRGNSVGKYRISAMGTPASIQTHPRPQRATIPWRTLQNSNISPTESFGCVFRFITTRKQNL